MDEKKDGWLGGAFNESVVYMWMTQAESSLDSFISIMIWHAQRTPPKPQIEPRICVKAHQPYIHI